MLAEHLDNPAVRRKFPPICILWKVVSDPELLAHRINVVQFVGRVFIRTEDAEVLHVKLHHVAKKRPKRTSIFSFNRSRLLKRESIFPEVRKAQSSLQSSAISMRIRPHAPSTNGSKFLQLRNKCSILIKELFWF